MTSSGQPNVLLVEDDVLLAEAYMAHLAGEDCDIDHVETGRAALTAIDRVPPDVILLDLLLPDMHGREIVEHVAARELDCTIVVPTSQASVKVAVEAMRSGAFDFLVKPIDPDRLSYTLRNALERQRLRRVVETYEQAFSRDRFAGFIGASPVMQAVYRMIESAVTSKATVFVTGESGTGKELCARAIHDLGPRRDGPFVTLNCAAIPRELLESEIFGHVRGAFTGAAANRDGAAARADGGTLFFDEIGEMEIGLQSKLLRFVQTGTFQRVGDSRGSEVDVRFVCATNRDPLEQVRAGGFREDLYYRLHVIPIELPPLRERGDDILLLARELLALFTEEEGKRFTGFSPRTASLLGRYEWPGNVRELQNVLRNVVVLNDVETVTANLLPEWMSNQIADADPEAPRLPSRTDPTPVPRGAARDMAVEGPAAIRPLADREREIIEDAIALCDGNIPLAAAHLGISNSTIYRKRRAWETA